jgi:3-oxoacyl-[acyl-carrier-protein] synthase-3
MKPLGLLSIGAYAPEQRLTNQDLERMVDTTDDWIVRRTGIHERRIAPKDVFASDLAAEAARSCLSKVSVRPDLLVSSSSTAETSTPYQASKIAHKLELANLAAFDINAACSGLIYGMTVAASLIRAGSHHRALVTAGEKMSQFTDYTDRSSCVLFGDGGAAVLLADEGFEHELIDTELGCDPSGSDLVRMGDRFGHPLFWQDGKKVFKFAVHTLNGLVDRLLERAQLTDKDRYFVIPHQANLRMMESVAEQRGLPMDRFVMNIQRYGNTSSASIGIALEEAWREGRFQKGDHVLLVGFGGGLSWAGATIRW